MSKRRLTAFVIVMALFLCAAAPVSAAALEPEELICRMINYYYHHQQAAAEDIACLNEELASADPQLAEKWERIFGYWTWANEEMEIIPEVLPDGLPDDDSLCIVVLGYALLPNGDMQDELIGRLEVALASAQKYPNAYIACTGGGTASREPDATEADRMAQWLLEQGIPEERIIVENQSRDTSQNARFTLDILSSQYPGVENLAVITSDYHLPRGTLLFYAQAQLSSDDPLEIVAGAAYEAGRGDSESMNLQASAVAKLAGVSIADMEAPTLSRLTSISVSGPTEYAHNSSPALTVTAHYDSGLTRDITDEATVTGFHSDTPGPQTISVSFREYGAEMEVLILPPPTEEPTTAPTEGPPETEPPAPQQTSDSGKPLLIPISAWTALLVLLVVLLVIKKIRRR